MTTAESSDPNSSLVKLKKSLKVVIYKNKYFPQQYIPRKKQLLNKLLDGEKEKLNIKDLNSEDEEEIAENVRQELITQEKRRIFYSNARPNLPKNVCTRKNNVTKDYRKVPFLKLEKHKLRNMFLELEQKDKTTDKQKELLICLKSMHYSRSNVWTSPQNLINAINDSLLTRNWSNVTHLLLQLVNYKDNKYKPILRKVYEIMDKLSPVILENDLQGEYKNIHGSCKQILDSTTVV